MIIEISGVIAFGVIAFGLMAFGIIGFEEMEKNHFSRFDDRK